MKQFYLDLTQKLVIIYALLGLVEIVKYSTILFYIGFIIVIPYWIYIENITLHRLIEGVYWEGKRNE